LGAFLSGGIDSSIVAALASRHKPDLQDFFNWLKDEPYFDETRYARMVAKKLNTQHTVFSLTNDDLYAHVHSILDYIDEPFADSSAYRRLYLKRGNAQARYRGPFRDGADELLAGYNKHAAFNRVIHKGWSGKSCRCTLSCLEGVPGSRNNPLSNKFRQLQRFAE